MPMKPKVSSDRKLYRNPLDGYSSELKPIIIPLHNFKHYHNGDSAEKLDDSYIGRRTIIGKLKSWITDEDTLVGTYLVTGYRGMGKSSFVNRVLEEIQASRSFVHRAWFTSIKLLLIIFTIVLCVLNREVRDENSIRIFTIGILLGATLLSFVWVFKMFLRICRKKMSDTDSINNGKLRTEYLEVRINIGKEIITKADDIMRLIVKNVYNHFRDYVYGSPNKHMFYSYIKLCIMLIITFVVISYTQISPLYKNYSNFSALFAEAYNSVVGIYNYYNVAGTLLLSVIVMFIAYHLTNYVFYLIGKIRLFGFPTYESILSNLSNLYERSVASVEKGESIQLSQTPFFSRFRRYDKATLREIEQELIQIFNDISNKKYISRWHWVNTIRFVIVLDELDKVDVADREAANTDELPYYDVSSSGFTGSQNARKRKQQLMKTLANMKYFLSTVKAKFIFVGGRELFDAYLGDVSDREYSISSVFDGVLNINSFFTDGVKGSDVTSMTEEFVCSKLAPAKRKVKTLRDYYEYLSDLEKSPDSDMDESTKNRLVTFLYQYILYLVHISNGSPKKISVFFEKSVRSEEHLTKIMKVSLPKHEKRGSRYYLSFGVKDIYKVGFMHYISYPLIQTMSGKANVFDDKLLVSTSFIINHIYKYHNTGFSWRNLEHIPELLDMNKNPELRDFLGSIVSLLNQTHLATIQSGLYLFKFPMRISEEISFISKQIEDISAVFHFSKDESQPVKKHYIHQLDYYTHDRNDIKDADLYTLASLHHILADIYQADEDYSQAIYEYQTGLQLVSRQLNGESYDDNPHWISKMLFIIRNMLKMGVAYEKRKTYDSAYTTYSELNKHLADYREFKEGDLGLDYYLYKKDDANIGWDALLYKSLDSNGPYSMPLKSREEKFMLDSKSLEVHDYAFAADQITYEFTRFLTPKKMAMLMRQSIFSDVRMAYLPTLAKLFVLEKMDTEGITSSNLELAEAEFFYLHLFVNDELRPLVYSDFFQKMGDILYYKNGLPAQPSKNVLYALALNGYDIRGIKEGLIKFLRPYVTEKIKCEADAYCYENSRIDKIFEVAVLPEESAGEDWFLKVIEENIEKELPDTDKNKLPKALADKCILKDPRIIRCMAQREKMFKAGRRIPCHACKYYNMSLNSILRHILIDEDFGILENLNISKSAFLLPYLIKNKQRLLSMPQNLLLMVANTLKGLANAKLSCSDLECSLSSEFLSWFFKAFEVFYDSKSSDKEYVTYESNSSDNLQKAMMLYLEAGIFFNMAGRTNDASQMFRQILEILNLYLRVKSNSENYLNDLNTITGHLRDIGVMVDRTIRILYGNYEGINMLEVSILKDLFMKNTHEDISLNLLPMTPDIEELIYRYYALYLRCDSLDVFKGIYNSGMMSRVRQLCTFSHDVQHLRFKFLMNSKIVEHLAGIKLPPTLTVEGSKQDQIFDGLNLYIRKSKSDIISVLHSWGIAYEDSVVPCDTVQDKMAILNFFIIDTLSCLSKIKNIIYQLNNPTTYISYFMGDICYYITCWRKIYDDMSILYQDAEDYYRSYGRKQFVNKSLIYRRLCQSLASENTKEQFLLYAEQRINKKEMEDLYLFYNAEQALRCYENAREMHTEGRSYKENILTLYFLDDDLNNDSIQQNLALERYLINTDNLSLREGAMAELLKGSRLFMSKSYLN